MGGEVARPVVEPYTHVIVKKVSRQQVQVAIPVHIPQSYTNGPITHGGVGVGGVGGEVARPVVEPHTHVIAI